MRDFICRSWLFRIPAWVAAFLIVAHLVAPGAVRADVDSLIQGGGLGSSGSRLFGSSSSDEKPKVSVLLAPADAKPGDLVTLSVTITVPPGNHIYSTSKSFSGRTKIRLLDTPGLAPDEGDFEPDHPPKKHFEPVFKQDVEEYNDRVTFSRQLHLVADAKPEDVEATVSLDYQVCNDKRCMYLKDKYTVTLSTPAGSESPASPPKSSQASAPPAIKTNPLTKEETPQIDNKPGPVAARFSLSPENAKPGETVTLTIVLKIDEAWHTYSITQPPDQAATATIIKTADINGLVPLDDTFTPGAPPTIKELTVGTQKFKQEVYHGEVTWTRRFRVEPTASAGNFGLAGSIRYQVCTEQQCLLPKKISFALGAVPEQKAVPENNDAPQNIAAAVDAPPAPESDATQQIVPTEEHPGSQGLVPFLITAVLAGFAALLTPCVFPMVPITVSFFLKQSEKSHHRPLSMALVYCAGIVGTFTLLGLLMAVVFGATKLNALANDPWLNLFIAGVMVFFGFNLLGMFEIRIPSSLLTWTSGKEGQGGFIGALFMALTFTLVSFTCTFAFVGGLLVFAAKGAYYWPILGMLAFSAAFALPFFFLALFPSYLQKLPKSGGWMNRVKVTMGLIECGAAFKFLSVADLAWNPVPMLFDYTIVMSSWMVLSLCTGLYLLGMFRFPHDTPSDSVSVPRFMVAGTFLGLAAYLAVGLFAAEKPSGRLWDMIAAFAPPRFSSSTTDLGPVLTHDGLDYALDVERALEVAEKENLPVFLDFTGVNCTNCRLMEFRMAQPQLRQRLEKFIRVQLYADNVPTITDEQIAEAILERNRQLQVEWFGDVTLPSYAVVTPGKERLSTIKGLQDEAAFAAFLDRGLEGWQKRMAGNSGKPNRATGRVDTATISRR